MIFRRSWQILNSSSIPLITKAVLMPLWKLWPAVGPSLQWMPGIFRHLSNMEKPALWCLEETRTLSLIAWRDCLRKATFGTEWEEPDARKRKLNSVWIDLSRKRLRHTEQPAGPILYP